MNTTPTFDCEFMVCAYPKYAAYGVKGYCVGKKSFRSIESLTEGVTAAFGKDLGTGRFLQVTIVYEAPDGKRQGVLTKENYEEGLTIIEQMKDEELLTLDELLGEESETTDEP